MVTTPATQVQVDSLEERLARLEKLRDEDAAKIRVATVALGAAVLITAVGVRAANRRSFGTSVHVPSGYSFTALPPSVNR